MLRQAGTPLEPSVRTAFERRFGRDLGHVRLHVDPEASRAAAAMGARGFALGRHIVIRKDLYDPTTVEGRRLLTHEMTHVVQQAAFLDRELDGAPVLSADHPTERQASDGERTLTQLAAPAIQLDREELPEPSNAEAESDAIIERQDALLAKIEREFGPGGRRRKVGTREQRLTAAFGALEPSYAAIVERAIDERKLKGYSDLRADVRQRLDAILAERKASVPRLNPGIFGRGQRRLNEPDYFIVRYGVTVDEVARFLSDDPELPAALARDNNIPPGQPLDAGTLVRFPKDLRLRRQAERYKVESLSSGTYVGRWGPEIEHSGERSAWLDNIPLTPSEYRAIRQNRRAQAWRPRPRTPAEQAAALAEDRRRAQLLPNPFLSFFFPTSRLYVKDQSLLMTSDFFKAMYRTSMRGFDAGTNLNRATGAVGVGVNLAPLALLQGAAAVKLVAGTNLGQWLAYGARHVYLNAPSIYGDAMLYGGAVVSGIELSHLYTKVRASGFEASDIPQLLGALTPLLGGWTESTSMRGGGGGTSASSGRASPPSAAGAPTTATPAAPPPSAVRGSTPASVATALGRPGTSSSSGPVPPVARPGAIKRINQWRRARLLHKTLEGAEPLNVTIPAGGTAGATPPAVVQSGQRQAAVPTPATSGPARAAAKQVPGSRATRPLQAPSPSTRPSQAPSPSTSPPPVTPARPASEAPGSALPPEPGKGTPFVASQAIPNAVADLAEVAGLSEDAPYEVGQLREVKRVRTTRSGRQLSSLETIPRTPAQAGPIRSLHGQRMDAAQQAAWQATTTRREQDELAEVTRLWNIGTQQSQDQARTLARGMFDRHRDRHWRAVRADPELRAIFESAGMRFTGGKTSAPLYELPDGTQVRLTIEHSNRLTDDPTRAVDQTNLQYVLGDENSVFLEFIRRFDPFQ
jgi:hypothetical protein